MKKIVAMLMMITLVLSLVGCSSTRAISWKDGTLFCGTNVINLTEYKGYGAAFKSDTLELEFYLCDSIEECPHNTLGVFEESMSKYKNAKYYEGYLGTQVWMFVPNDGRFTECHATSTSMSVSQMIELIYGIASVIPLSEDINETVINDKMLVDAGVYDLTIRQDEVIIPGLLRIMKDTGSIVATTTAEINGTVVGKVSSNSYDYYVCDELNLIIQAALGIDVNQFITFK